MGSILGPIVEDGLDASSGAAGVVELSAKWLNQQPELQLTLENEGGASGTVSVGFIAFGSASAEDLLESDGTTPVEIDAADMPQTIRFSVRASAVTLDLNAIADGTIKATLGRAD